MGFKKQKPMKTKLKYNRQQWKKSIQQNIVMFSVQQRCKAPWTPTIDL